MGSPKRLRIPWGLVGEASTLGLHRAIYYHEQAGTDETFRPYAAPPDEWWG